VRLTRIPSVRLAALRARNFLAFAGSISERAATAQGAPDALMHRIVRRARGPAGLEIRPLTLIFGRNRSGKSALIKLLRLALRVIAEPTTDRRDLDRDAGGSFVRSIDVNLDGEQSDWPEGEFLESYREVMAMQRAIR
jgi:AAA15 family ATPase/GTPase